MERCDFSSISTCLKNQISESNQMNQPDFLYELFEDFMNDPINEDFSMDNGLICRWITGHLHVIHTGRYDFGYKKAGTCISI